MTREEAIQTLRDEYEKKFGKRNAVVNQIIQVSADRVSKGLERFSWTEANGIKKLVFMPIPKSPLRLNQGAVKASDLKLSEADIELKEQLGETHRTIIKKRREKYVRGIFP